MGNVCIHVFKFNDQIVKQILMKRIQIGGRKNPLKVVDTHDKFHFPLFDFGYKNAIA